VIARSFTAHRHTKARPSAEGLQAEEIRVDLEAWDAHGSQIEPVRLGVFALLVQAGLRSARDRALISLLALNGLRISEALGADIEAMDMDRGHRTLAIVRRGGKHVIMPLAPRTARTLDLYLGERASGPILLGATGQRMDRYAADRSVKRLAKRAEIT